MRVVDPLPSDRIFCISGRRNLRDLGPLGPSVGARLFEQVQIAEELPFEVPRQRGVVFHLERDLDSLKHR